MLLFLNELKSRNETLFYFGILCLVFSIISLILTKTNTTQVYGVNAWFKPFKFSISTFLFVWAMAWYCYYLPNFNTNLYSWTVLILLGFEIVYIAIMAAKGQQSHFNLSTPFYAAMFSLMALAATLVTIYTAYVGVLFFSNSFTHLPDYYVWAIRLGILIFVIFSFQGFLMGSRLSHTVGAINDNSNLFIVGWSKIAGDLRIPHFIGMHALQLLPILSFYLFKDIKVTVIFSVLYGLLAIFTLVQALQGQTLWPSKQIKNEISR